MKTEQSLNSIPEQVISEVSRIKDYSIAVKLMAMGVLPGSRVEVIRRGPFGSSCYLKVDGQCLALRHTEAEHILVH